MSTVNNLGLPDGNSPSSSFGVGGLVFVPEGTIGGTIDFVGGLIVVPLILVSGTVKSKCP